ncbi:MAG: T9SS type A sorting domain-containing protein, partial [bacterium]
GNILVCHFDNLFRLNYRTGAGLNKLIPNPAFSLTAPGVDAVGNIFVAHVASNSKPIQIYDKDFNFLGVAVDTSRGFSRSFEVSPDGNTIYWAGYTNHAVYKYTRPDEFSSFALTDTILKGFDSESFAWNPRTGYLWLSAGSYNDLPNRFPGATTSWSPNAWYAYDPATNQVVDSLKWVFNTPNNINERPRAIAFSVGGDTAYVGCFGGNYPAVQMFVRATVGVAERPGKSIPEGYSLSQNYPNPFNPATEIIFAIGKAGFTTVKVYDMLGKEAATLMSRNLPAGNHKVTFEASRLAGGNYIYELKSGEVRITKKMSFLK